MSSYFIPSSLPNKGVPIRSLWIDAIRKHQLFTHVDDRTVTYMICERHFDATDIVQPSKKLKANAIPIHFPSKDGDEVSNDPSNPNSCVNCMLYETKLKRAELHIVRLQNEISTLKYIREKYHPSEARFDPSVHHEMCEVCRKQLTKLELETHLCLGKRIQCPYCVTSFHSTKKFLRHLTRLHRLAMQKDGENIQYKCDKCPTRYDVAILLECHQKSHESEMVITKMEPDESDDTDYIMIEPIVKVEPIVNVEPILTINYPPEMHTIGTSDFMNQNETIRPLSVITKSNYFNSHDFISKDLL